MSDDIPFILLLGLIVVLFFGGLFGMGYAEYTERMACLERGGTMTRAGCLFHVAPPTKEGETQP